jgi:DNA (cytosine-5)-methyltransferase 1
MASITPHESTDTTYKNDMDTTKTITHIGLCAGYGGIELGLSRAIPNLRSVALCEIEAFAAANLVSKMEAGLMDAAPIWTDLKTFPWAEFRGKVDILTGGYPCQPFSAAGKRLGKEDPRHLWPFIADGIAAMRPSICFFENVEGHISMGLSDVIEDLAGMGYRTTWGIFSAREVGAPHQRKRVFILAYLCGVEPQGREWIRQAGEEGISGEPDNDCYQAWPSRPGEPQHGWEPPRVVLAHSADNGCSPSEASGRICGKQPDARRQKESESVKQSARSGAFSDIQAGEFLAASSGWSNGQQPTEQQGWNTSGRSGEESGAMGNAVSNCDRRSDRTRWRIGEQEKDECARAGRQSDVYWQTQSSLGGDADGSTDWMDDAELFVTSDNRTDELRLLGNGVVPATAERAFRTLLKELTE